MGKAFLLFLAAFLFSGCTAETYNGTWRPTAKPCARVKTGGLAAPVAKSVPVTYEFCDPHYRIIHGEERLDAKGHPLGLALVIGGKSAGQHLDHVWAFAQDLKAQGTLTIEKTSIVTAKSFFATLFLLFFGAVLFFVIRSGRRKKERERAKEETRAKAPAPQLPPTTLVAHYSPNPPKQTDNPAELARALSNLLNGVPQETSAVEEIAPAHPAELARSRLIGTLIDSGVNFRLSPDTRARHLYLIGKTRTGKTTLVQNLIAQDIETGQGLCFLDPHGDAALEIIGEPHISPRVSQTIYFDPMRQDAPAFNPLRLPYPPHKLTEDIISLFKMFFGDSWGYRLEHILRYSFLTLISQKEPRTLADLRRLLINSDFRADIIRTTEEASLREFWQTEFPSMEKAAVNPIINKLSALLAPTSPLERIFSAKENDLDFSDILNTSKILIVNLSKGTLGDEPSRLLGGFITTGIQQAALARATLPEDQRTPFYFYVDEFQNYAVASFETILAEAAKYRLFLTLANQNLGQLTNSLERAIFGNVGTLIAFQVSAEDAATLKKEMHHRGGVWRIQGQNAEHPVEDFIPYARDALKRFHPPTSDYDRIGHTNYAHAQRLLKKLEEPNLSIESLKDITREYSYYIDKPSEFPKWHKEHIFPRIDFRDSSYPETEDFLNLPPHHAFARIGRAENVFAFRTLPARPSYTITREEVLHHQQYRTRTRQKAKGQATNGARQEAPPRPQEKPPHEDEDFKF